MQIRFQDIRHTFSAEQSVSTGDVARARNRMFASIEVASVEHTPKTFPKQSVFSALGVGVASVCMVLFSVAGMSANAMPGDIAYGIKRMSERVTMVFQSDSPSRTAYHLKLAERRMQEMQYTLESNERIDWNSVRNLSSETDIELHQAHIALREAIRSAADGDSVMGLALLADTVSQKAEHIHTRIAQYAAHTDFQQIKKNSTKALSVFADTAEETSETDVKETLKTRVAHKIEESEKELEELESDIVVRTASVTGLAFAKEALEKAHELIAQEQYSDAVDQIALSEDIVATVDDESEVNTEEDTVAEVTGEETEEQSAETNKDMYSEVDSEGGMVSDTTEDEDISSEQDVDVDEGADVTETEDSITEQEP